MPKYETKLSKQDEKEFQTWFASAKENGIIHPQDNGADYDFRGFWTDLVKNNHSNKQYSTETHFPDTYKKPNHETFSVESKYAKGNMKKYAGIWNRNNFIPPKTSYRNRRIADILFE